MHSLLKLFALSYFKFAFSSTIPIFQSLNVTVNSTTTTFQIQNVSLSQPIISLGYSGVVQIVVQAGYADSTSTSSNITFLLNSTLGSLLTESQDVTNTLLSNPQYLQSTVCKLEEGSLCVARVPFLCHEIISNLITRSDPGCSAWTYWTLSNISTTIPSRKPQNRTTFSYQFSFDQNATSLINFTNPYRQVCIAARAGAYNTSYPLCIVFRFPAPSVPLDCTNLLPGFSLLLNPSDFPLAACGASSLVVNTSSQLSAAPPSCGLAAGVWCQWPITVAIGQSVRAKIYFKANSVAPDPAQSAFQISLLSDPGLPNHASVSATAVEYVALFRGDTSNAFLFPIFSREVAFHASLADLQASGADPLALAASLDYGICFAGHDAVPAPGPPPAALCGKIRVVAPAPQVIVAMTDFPLGADCVASGACNPSISLSEFACGSPTFQTLEHGTYLGRPWIVCDPLPGPFDVRVRCAYAWTLHAYDARTPAEVLGGLDPASYSPVLAEDPDEPLPPGASVSAPEFVERTFDGLEEAFPRRLTRQAASRRPLRVGPRLVSNRLRV